MTLEVSGASLPPRDSDILPYDDGVPMETTQHRVQMNLLIDTLCPYLAEQGVTAYVAGNNFLYYQKGHPPKFCGPDFYVVLGRQETGQKSYVVWEEENRFPDVIVELLSESTESLDRGAKFIRYRDLFKTAEYYLYDPITRQLEGYRLEQGRYQPISSTGSMLRCESLNLGLSVRGQWLRWIAPDGTVLPTGQERAEEATEQVEEALEKAEEATERAEQERQRAEREQQRAEREQERADHEQERAEREQERADHEQKRAEREQERAERERERAEALAQKLRELGLDPDSLS